jgi:rhodanese-related sulfurtransferase
MMRQIEAAELARWLADEHSAVPLLLDVREPWEFAHCRLPGAVLMPMASVPARYLELDREQPTVVICHHGMRSAQVCLFLEQQGFTRLINLAGGVAAWASEVDPAMAQY